jgi:two-component system, NtrC family, response regulator AlgB
MAEINQSLPPLRILVIDDEANIRTTLSMCLEAEGHSVVAAGSVQNAVEEIARHVFDLVYLDVRLGMENGLDFLPQLRAESPWAKVVVITAYASIETAILAMKRGAADYLPKPFDATQVQMLTRKFAEQRQLERRVEALQATLGAMDAEADLPTQSPALQQAIETARLVAASKAPLLVCGERGVGKGRLARAVHAWSNRAGGPFATVSCQLSADALEAELFGLTPAAAPAAGAARVGKICACDTGTLLLDEVGQMPLRLQPKLLQLLRDKQYERMDDAHPRPIDVRIIATSSEDLRQAVQRGAFRADLMHDLEMVRVEIPALRDRPDDISLLAERYMAYFSKENHRPIVGFTPDAMFALEQYAWPGNVRELRNVVERAVLLCRSDKIDVRHFPPNLLNSTAAYSVGDLIPLDTIKMSHIHKVLASTRSIRRAAAILEIDASTLCRILKRYDAQEDRPAV